MFFARWMLVSFEDNSYSLVKEDNVRVLEGELLVGSTCKVKEGRQVYDGKVLRIGKYFGKFNIHTQQVN